MRGITASSAALLLSVIGVGSTAGRFFLGTIAGPMGRERSRLLMFAGMAASLSIRAVSASFWPLAVFAFVFGVFYGGWVAVLPAVVMAISVAATSPASSACSTPAWRSGP